MQQIKNFVRDALGIPPAAALFAAGCVAHLALNALLRKSPASPWGLLSPLVLGAALEAWEIWEHYQAIGLTAPGNDPLAVILVRHGLDVGIVLSGPLLLVGISWLSTRLHIR